MDILAAVSTDESKALAADLARKLDSGRAFGSFSPSIYDTAWLARVSKPGHESGWLFPECFEYLLQAQDANGEWTAHVSEIDRIINTMAALVALKEHKAQADQIDPSASVDLVERISRAEQALRQRLRVWDVVSSVHVGTEILVTLLLGLLEKDGSRFDFPGRNILMSWNQRKFRKFRPEMLYSPVKTTLVYSMEALCGKIDFDKVAHHLDERGSMMASPAATSAYLMNRSTWDPAAEAYLRTVVRYGSGNGGGGIPGAFPSGFFEVTWIMSTLIKAQQDPHVLVQSTEAAKIRSFLQSQYESHNGVLGFDSGLLQDSDDTAKTILTLNLLGYPASPQRMVEEFEGPYSFRTYKYEDKTSFSANCNVLDALVHYQRPQEYLPQIIKVSHFLCREFNAGHIRDKWNLSDGYSRMLLTLAFLKLLDIWDQNLVGDMPQDLIAEKIPIVLTQIAMRTLQEQLDDGSWAFNTTHQETTAYAVLALKSLSQLPWLTHFQSPMKGAIRRGSVYLMLSQDSWDEGEPIWVSKATYALPPLARAYKVAALCAGKSYAWSDKVKTLVTVPAERVGKMAKFFSRLPIFTQDKLWLLEGNMTLAYLYQAQLRRAGSAVFPRREGVDNKYLEYIPFTWIAMNCRNHNPLSGAALWDMMLISLLVYQLDEYMETVLGTDRGFNDIEELRQIIRGLCDNSSGGPSVNNTNSTSSVRLTNGSSQAADGLEQVNGHSREDANSGILFAEVKAVLLGFSSHILRHPSVAQSPEHVRKGLQDELCRCMLAHLDHEEDNIRFTAQRRAEQALDPSLSSEVVPFRAFPGTYYLWMHTTAAMDTQCPSIFLFFSCLVAADLAPGEPFFVGARQSYLSSAVSAHLANLCRQYNDHGSASRDAAEGSLNSLNFPEFHRAQQRGGGDNGPAGSHCRTDALKADLFFIAEYERECLERAKARLFEELRRGGQQRGDDKAKALSVFIDTTDLYGQIYVAKDISNRLR